METENTNTNTPSVSGSLFTCVTCYVAFRDAENQRIHFQTEWHTYNLKRKVAQMKPVSLEEFQTKVAVQTSKSKEAEELLNYSGKCDICNKQYSSKNAYENHLSSKKHKENEQNGVSKKKPNKIHEKQGKEEEKEEKQKERENEEADENEEETIDKKIANARVLKEEECLFCLFQSTTFESNLEHMAKAHSFFIPDVQFLIDSKGLIKYLGQKISIGNVCLYCNEKGKAFHSIYAVQKHMIDKGHCKIWYEDDADLEFEDFYDFSTSYPDHEGKNPDEDPLEPELLSTSNFELTLPNGSKIGHRSMKGYYKQRFKSDDTRDSTVVNKIMSQYRLLGWTETNFDVEKRDLRRRNREKQRNEMELGVKANGLLRHMRKQVMC